MSALTLALPSKGRLQEQAIAHLADAGIKISQSRGARDYAATLTGVENINLVLLSASEIAGELRAGRVHMGVTGEDLLRESGADDAITVVDKLGFGRANVVVAVPRAWIDVSTMHDLDDVASAFHHRHHRRLRVATKYVNITRDFFARHGVADYRIVESLGATEGAPASGAAEAIVDITTTGATLAANNLKILDDGLILESQAVLTASVRATWTEATRKAAAGLLDRLVARQLAKTSAILRVRMDDAVEKSLAQLERAVGVRVLSRPDAGGGSAEVALLVPNANLTTTVNALRGLGATGAISTETAEYVFLAENPLYAALVNSLTRG